MKKLTLLFAMILLIALSTLFIGCKQESTTSSDKEECEEHDFSDWSITPATCTEAGKKKRTCNTCGKRESKKIDALGHTEQNDEEILPTCAQSGLTAGKHCSACGLVIVKQETIPPLEHNYDTENITWTWNGTATATATLICINDNTHTTQFAANVTKNTENAPTCTKDGNIQYIATITYNGQTYDSQRNESILSLGHDTIKHNKRNPSCTSAGWYSYEECTRCNYSTYTEIPKLGHDIITHNAKAPTCTDSGWDTYQTCSRCDYSTYIEKSKLGHRYTNDICIRCSIPRVSEGLSFVSNGDGTCYVSDIGTCKDKNIIIPAISPSGEDVIGIGARAFYGDDITSIIIPEGVTYIEDAAFYMSDLTSITIPSTITEIRGANVFSYCSNLMEVNISDLSAWCKIKFSDDSCNPLYNFGYLYLNGELLTELIIPDNTPVNAYAFYRCSGITKVVFPDGIKIVGRYAFYYCRDLQSLTVPHSITSFGGFPFVGCNSLTDIYYYGTKSEWDKVGPTAGVPSSATIHYL